MLETVELVINKFARSFLTPDARRKIADLPLVLKFNELFLGKSQVDVVTPEGLVLKLNPLFHGHISTTQSVLEYEPEVREALVRTSKPGMITYDIGANIGIFTLLMSHLIQPGGKVYAIEPEMNNYKHLLGSISANNSINIFPMQIAVGDTDGTLQFDRRGGSFSGRIVDGDVHYKPTKNIVPMATMSIDSLVKSNIIDPPNLIKIDVEGFEGKVMLGMQEVISKYHPIIICELHAHLGDPSEVVYNVLASAGYSIYDLELFLAGQLLDLSTLDGTGKIIAMKSACH